MSVFDIDGQIICSDGSSNFSSVKDYGAIGDGISDDTSAIQNALYSNRNGGVLFFPIGTYKITESLLFYSKQTLFFENGATILQGARINNLLMSYCEDYTEGYDGTHDCLIYGATFDGSNYTINNTLVGLVHCKNITFENCTFKNAYGGWHNIEINSSYNIKIVNCDFEGSRKTTENGEMIQIDAIDNVNTWPWENRGAVDGTISKYIEIYGCIFHDDTLSPAIGNHSNSTDTYISIHDNIFVGLESVRGAINFRATNVDVYDNIFNGCTVGMGSGGATYYIRNNRFDNITTVSASSLSVVHNNFVNGSYIE